VEFLNNSIGHSGLNSALERIEEIEKLSRVFTGSPYVNKINSVQVKLGEEKFTQIISQVAKEHNVDPKLIEAVIEQESNFNPNAISKSGAIGLMQLMSGTAQELGVKDPLNPEENIRGGTKYLASLLNRYHGDVALALSAYNAGAGNVEKFKGIPPFQETQQYVKGIMSQLS